MYQFIIQRLLQALATIIVVSIVVFLFVHASGDPAALLLPEQATPEDIANLRAQLGLVRPMYISVVLAIPLGTLAALRRGSLVDVMIRVVAVFGQSMPSFWVPMLLML